MILIAAAVALVVAYYETGRRRYIRNWFWFEALFAGGIVTNAIPSIPDSPLLIMLAYTFFAPAYWNLLVGMIRFTGRESIWRKATAAATLTGWVMMGIFTLGFPNFGARFFFFNLWSMAVFSAVVVLLVQGRDGDAGPRNILSLGSAGFVALAWLARGFSASAFGTTSILDADPATVTATAMVSFGVIMFTISLFNLSQLRVARQLESVRDRIESAGADQGAPARLVSGVAHAMATPVGASLTALTALRDSGGMARMQVAPEDQRVLEAAIHGLRQSSQRLNSLRELYRETESDSPKPVALDRLAHALRQILQPLGAAMPVEVEGEETNDSEAETVPPARGVRAEQLVRLLVELVDLAERAAWVDPEDALSLRVVQEEHLALEILGIRVPRDIWVDAEAPLQRSQVRGFADALILGAIRERLENHSGVLAMQRIEHPDGIRFVFEGETS